ncbi:MAG: protein kinase, partial [Planctomycetes bacterium]|nr:protein kinase [Planctomycetota bacterium]
MNDRPTDKSRPLPHMEEGADLLDLSPADGPESEPAVEEVHKLGSPGNTLLDIGGPPVDAPSQTLLAVGPGDSAPNRPTTKVPPAPAPGPSRDSRYVIVREHARGGMGRVMLARDNAVGREVAIKELLPGRAGSSALSNRSSLGELSERFLREARVTGQLEHPGIVPVYEIGTRPDGSPFYAMKFVRGRTLADRLAEIRDTTETGAQKLALRLKLLDAFVICCEAVAFAHSRGVVHRDLKPQNLMLGDYGETLVLDWGLARIRGGVESSSVGPALPQVVPADTGKLDKGSGISAGSSSATLDGAIIGTPAYMAPEQAAGRIAEVDERSDVYSLGAILYEMVTGVPPYEGSTPESVVKRVLAGPPLPVLKREPMVPPELAALIERAMARVRSERLESARELVEQVRAFREGRTLSVYQYSAMELLKRFIARHRAVTTVGALAVAALLAAASWHYLSISEEKAEAERQRNDAQAQRAEADLQRRSAEDQRRDADEQRVRALELSRAEQDARKDAERQRQDADSQRTRAEAALLQAERGLADAYAMRARKALDDCCFNESLCFAAEALRHAEQAEARGILVALPSVYPLLHVLKPRTQAKSRFEEVYAAAVSPDGKLAATGLPEGSVWLFDLHTGERAGVLPAQAASAIAVAFDPAGDTLAVGYGDGTVRLWDRHTQILLAEQAAFPPDQQAGIRKVLGLAFSPDGRSLCAGAMLGQVALLDGRTLELRVRKQIDPVAWTHSVAYSPDGTRVLLGGSDNLLRLLDAATGEPARSLSGHEGPAYTCDYDPTGRGFASGSWDTTVRLWNADGGEAAVLRGHASIVMCVRYSPDGRLLASGSADGSVILWDVALRRRVAVLTGHGGWVQAVDFTPDGSAVVARTVDGVMRVWGLAGGGGGRLVGHSKEVFDVRFSPDGTRLVSASWDGTARVWDAGTQQSLFVLRGHAGWVMGATFSPDGDEILTCGFDGTLRQWDAASGAFRREIVAARGTPLIDLSCSPDGRLVAVSSSDNTVRIYARADGRLLHWLRGHEGPVGEVAFSPDGATLASVSVDKSLRLWDVETGSLLKTLPGHEDAVASVCWRADGKLLATASLDRTIRLWDPATATQVKAIEGHTDGVHNVRFTRDGKRLYSASGDKTVRLWDAE